MTANREAFAQNLKIEWLQRFSKSVVWQDLSKRKSMDGTYTEEDFWRDKRGPGHHGHSDQELHDRGLLFEVPDKGTFHAAYLPWLFSDGTPGKAAWSEEQHDTLAAELKAFMHRASVSPDNFNWKNLTVPSSILERRYKGSFSETHFYGDTPNEMSTGELKNVLIDGNHYTTGRSLSNIYITGTARFANIPADVINSKISHLQLNGHNAGLTRIVIMGSHVYEVNFKGEVNKIQISESEIDLLELHDADIGVLDISCEKICSVGLSLKGSVNKRSTFRNVNLNNRFEKRKIGLFDSSFGDKLDLIDSEFEISTLSDVQLKGPVEIRPKGKTIEELFAQEMLNIKEEDDGEKRESRRRDLERACQIICDRHNQDGRKDIEHRFRRLELIARSQRADADRSTRFVNWFYRVSSDFGVSLLRPLASLALIAAIFFVIYLGLATAEFAEIDFNGDVEWELVQSTALLAAEKAFPIGVSVDESKLFDGKFVGHEGGLSALAVGVLGTIQTILSGILIFLAGLAVRTKLLIG